MRKLFCLLLVLVCIGSAALAATVPSKTTADLNTTTKITTESGETVDSLVIIPIADAGESKAAYAQKLAVCNGELKKLAEVVAQTNSIEGYFGEVKIVDVNIRRLRLKIEDDAQEPRYIATVWGTGYKWSTD